MPFDVSDWTTRVLPGRLIAFGIGTMVTVIRVLDLGPTVIGVRCNLIDDQGVIRYIRIGEGGYNHTEKQIRDLLAER